MLDWRAGSLRVSPQHYIDGYGGTREDEAGKSDIKLHPLLHRELEASLN